MSQFLGISRFFTNGTHPFDLITFERRDALIPGPSEDRPTFSQRGVSVPNFWSQTATNIVAQKYFRGQLGSSDREWSAKQLIGRVVEKIGTEGRKNGYFLTDEEQRVFEFELAHLLAHQYMAFNSPVWFNIGTKGVQQASACFILSVQDDMKSILNWYVEEGIIFQGGSGAGVNLSNIRGSNEPINGGGTGSGPVTFMRGADSSAGTIKSGGKTRRAAKMVCLDIDHPDVQEFIWCKAHEEKKARALAAAGFDMSLNTEEGSNNWASLQYQNANNSVRVTDEFMKAVENDEAWDLINRLDGEPTTTVRAKDLFREIADAAWQCADPGLHYSTPISDWHTTPNFGPITSSNPCSEYLHVDDSSCNLASLNLMKFRTEEGDFDVDKFRHAVRVTFLAQEILISFADYPTEQIGDNTRDLRQIGLGYANAGAYLMASGLPYDSDEGRARLAAITSLMTGEAYLESTYIAERVGPFAAFDADRDGMLRVLKKHRSENRRLKQEGFANVVKAAKAAWTEAVDRADKHGVRNAQATVLAPTGTISFLMDCDTTGIEPEFALVKMKSLVGGGSMTIINRTVPIALQTLGYSPEEIGEIDGYVREHHTVIGAPYLKTEDYDVFAIAVGQENVIGPRGHIDMMGAVQPWISGAISKTVNMPSSATVEDIEEMYLHAWRQGVKALAIYRDGSKAIQPLNIKKREQEATEAVTSILGDDLLRGQRRRVPLDRDVISRHFKIGSVSGYIHVGLFEDGQPGDLFVTVAQAGSALRGMIDAWSMTFSLALQYGAPLESLVSKLAFTSFEPSGFTNDTEIRTAKSIVDYVARWMASHFLTEGDKLELGIGNPAEQTTSIAASADSDFTPSVRLGEQDRSARGEFKVKVTAGGELCPQCSNPTLQRTGSCKTCSTCGYNSGCG